jgi:cytochrome c oxidase subunit 2
MQQQSAFSPAGPQAAHIGAMWWYMLTVAAVVWVLVIVMLAFALRRSRTRNRVMRDEATESTMKRAVIVAASATVLILIGTLVYDVSTGAAMASLPRKKALRIEVTGHQWWWEVTYDDSIPANQVTTANEIHVPVGEPIQIIGQSRDVIHSLWAPNLFGKKDLIPGHVTATWFQADKPGIYRGQCAEFCGHQHAKMIITIVAEPRPQFENWYRAQLLPAPPMTDSLTRRGEAVFMSHSCSVCHTVGGTRALSNVGPPLTHIGSALTIAAGSLPNTRGNLAGWILDPQQIKPGVKMPPNPLSGPDLQALLAYLENLR